MAPNKALNSFPSVTGTQHFVSRPLMRRYASNIQTSEIQE